MLSTLLALQLISPTSRPLRFVKYRYSKQVDSLTRAQRISGHVAAKGDFVGKEPETEEAKKAALTGVDIVIIPAGVPRKSSSIHRRQILSDQFFKESRA